MNNSIIIAVAIVAAAVILKLPIDPGRYQLVGGGGGPFIRIDTRTGDGWQILFPQAQSGPHWVPFTDNGTR